MIALTIVAIVATVWVIAMFAQDMDEHFKELEDKDES